MGGITRSFPNMVSRFSLASRRHSPDWRHLKEVRRVRIAQSATIIAFIQFNPVHNDRRRCSASSRRRRGGRSRPCNICTSICTPARCSCFVRRANNASLHDRSQRTMPRSPKRRRLFRTVFLRKRSPSSRSQLGPVRRSESGGELQVLQHGRESIRALAPRLQSHAAANRLQSRSLSNATRREQSRLERRASLSNRTRDQVRLQENGGMRVEDT